MGEQRINPENLPKTNGHPIRATTKYINRKIIHIYQILHPVSFSVLKEVRTMKEVRDFTK